jgi:glycerol-3-phosphate O-acyltransferase
MGVAVDELARIQVNINRAADVNPINLLAMACSRRRSTQWPKADLLRQLELFKSLLEAVPYSGSRHRDRDSRRRRSSPTARK